jgi:hypothetical protein
MTPFIRGVSRWPRRRPCHANGRLFMLTTGTHTSAGRGVEQSTSKTVQNMLESGLPRRSTRPSQLSRWTS